MKRLNLKLAIILAVAIVLSIGAFVGVHALQTSRNSKNLINQAREFLEDKKYPEAYSTIKRYNKAYPKDAEGWKVTIAIFKELVEKDKLDGNETFKNLMQLKDVYFEYFKAEGDADVDYAARQDLVNTITKLLQFTRSDPSERARAFNTELCTRGLQQLSILREKKQMTPEMEFCDADFKAITGNEKGAIETCARYIGYDLKTKKFDEKKSAEVKNVDFYGLLAELLYKDSANQDAESIVNEMVSRHPSDAMAHYHAYAYWMRTSGNDAQKQQMARDQLTAAYAIDKTKPIIITEMFAHQLQKQDLVEAEKTALLIKEKFPKHAIGYISLAKVLVSDEKRFKEFEEVVKKGLELSPNNFELVFLRFARQVTNVMTSDPAARPKEIAKAKDYLKELKTLGGPTNRYMFHEAQLLMHTNDFKGALDILLAYRDKLSNLNEQVNADLYIANCHFALRQFDMARTRYQAVLKLSPKHPLANMRLGIILAAQNNDEEALKYFKNAKSLVNPEQFYVYRDMWAPMLRLYVKQQLNQPDDKRDWTAVDDFYKQLQLQKDEVITPAEKNQLRVQQLTDKNELDAAVAEAKTILEKDNTDLASWQIYSQAMLRAGKHEELLAVYATAPKAVADSVFVKLYRTNCYAKNGGEEAKTKLLALLSEMQTAKPEELVAVQLQVAGILFRLNFRDDAIKLAHDCLKVVEKFKLKDSRPYEMNIVMALQKNDAKELEYVVNALKTSPFQGKPLEQIAFCHWRLQMLRNSITPRLQNLETATSFKLTEQERAWLTEAEKMTDVMIKENSSNQLAYILKADIFGLSNRPQDQIAYFKKALDLGELDHLRSWQFLVFLTKYSTDAEIEKVIGRINHHNDPKLMRLLFETYLRLGKKANAQELMAALAPNEKNASQIDKFWYAQALRATNDKAKSLAILQQLVEEDVKFELPDAWLELLSTYIRENNTAAADTLLKKMAALPPSERLDMTLFRLRESMGDMTGAKAMLDQALAKYPENFSIMINAIEFHIRTNNPATALNQAEKLLEKCRANKDKPEGAQQLQTAELVYALASSKLDPSYAKFNETDAKFEKAMYNGDELSVLVLAKRVQLLLDRKEPVSVRKAIKLMELLAQKQPLTYGDKVRLARMYNMVGDQVNSRKTIESLMNESSKTNPDLSYMYAELQYDNGKYGDAKGHLENYISRTRPEGRVDTSFLMAKILVKLNQGAAGAKLLSDSLGPRPLNEQSFFRLQAAAKLLEELKQIPEAEKLYAELGQLNPTGKAHYARFVGCHVDSRKGLQLLEEVASKDAEPVLRVCISSGTAIVRFIRNRDQFSEVQNYYNAITKWFDRLKALEAQNSTATIETDMIQAEVNEVQGKLQESIDIYRRLLDSKKLNPLGQAGIQNNLAYMQILLGTAPALKDARVQINQAIDFMGPQSDLLDTRGTISLFEGNYQAALRDFEDAVLDRSDAKFFHLALAHFKLKNNNAALEALDKAKNYNFVPQDLHAVEKKLYNEMMIGLGQKP